LNQWTKDELRDQVPILTRKALSISIQETNSSGISS
jgi:hypothetical protein